MPAEPIHSNPNLIDPLTDPNSHSAVARASQFLRKQVAKDSYFLGARSSDASPCPVDGFGHVFSAYFIVNALHGEIDHETASVISDRIDREEVNGLWGFGEGQPIDSDDTTYVLRTRKLLGKDAPWFQLREFYSATDGLFKTFPVSGPCTLARDPGKQGNLGAHLDVNANIYSFLLDAGGSALTNLNMIVDQQAEDGSWSGYFYPGKYYCTMLCLACLCKKENYRDIVEKASEFLLATQADDDGSWGQHNDAYTSALALNALALAGTFGDPYRRGVDFLLHHQREDGSWSSDEIIYSYVHRDRPRTVWRAFDVNRVLTTSLAVSAIKSLLKS